MDAPCLVMTEEKNRCIHCVAAQHTSAVSVGVFFFFLIHAGWNAWPCRLCHTARESVVDGRAVVLPLPLPPTTVAFALAGIEIGEGTETTLPPSFFADVTGLLDRLDTAEALGRACVAATETALPSLGDIQMLLEASVTLAPKKIQALPLQAKTTTF